MAVAMGVATLTATGVVRSGMAAAWGGGENYMDFINQVLNLVFNLMGGFLLATAAFLIYNAFSMSVTRLTRQVGALRSLGMSRRQVMAQMRWEAWLTGFLGIALGWVAGPWLGRAVLGWMRLIGLEVGQGSISLPIMLVAGLLGLGMTWLSAMLPARRAAEIPPLAAMRSV
jgi:putative ABC transport system permease protein